MKLLRIILRIIGYNKYWISTVNELTWKHHCRVFSSMPPI